MTHKQFFNRCAKGPLLACVAACAFVAYSRLAAGSPLIAPENDDRYLKALWLLFSLAVVAGFRGLPRAQRSVKAWNLWIYPWIAALLPGIIAYAAAHRLWHGAEKMIFRLRLRNLEKSYSATLPVTPMPPWLLMRHTKNGRAGYAKPQTVLETSSVAPVYGLGEHELARRSRILEIDRKIDALRQTRDQIRQQWVYVFTDARDAVAQVQERTHAITASLTASAHAAEDSLQTRHTETPSGLGETIEVHQRQLAKLRHAFGQMELRAPEHSAHAQKYKDAFDQLYAFPNVLAVEVVRNAQMDAISVYTDTLYLENFGIWHELGNFRIDFWRYVNNMPWWDFGIRNLASTSPINRATPYGLEPNEHCFGEELKEIIFRLLQAGEHPAAVVHMLKSITRLNSSRFDLDFAVATKEN